MRTRTERAQDRAAFLTPPYEEPAVMLAHAIAELCLTIDDASERIALDIARQIAESSDDVGRHLKQTTLVTDSPS
jgi:hypothetical protein